MDGLIDIVVIVLHKL